MKIKTFLLLILIICNTILISSCRKKCDNHFDNNNDYRCDTCQELIDNDNYYSSDINTIANDAFFPTKKNTLHQEEILNIYKNKYNKLIDPQIYNLTPEEKSNQYDLDIFIAETEKNTNYYLKYKEDIYPIAPFDFNNQTSHCLTNIAVTDINKDGYLEFLTSIVSFSKREYYDYCTSYIFVIDTFTKYSIQITDYNNVAYFKENDQGVISIYDTFEIMPIKEDLVNGKLDEKYYDLANNLFDTPTLNTSCYVFKEKNLSKKCKLFSVDIAIDDSLIVFPYLFKSTYTPAHFSINVKMIYLGKTFFYTNGTSYLDGATVSFINGDKKINCEWWDGATVVTKFVIFKGMKIEHDYRYNEDLNNLFEPGIYDMVIKYENKENKIEDTIILKDFLLLKR